MVTQVFPPQTAWLWKVWVPVLTSPSLKLKEMQQTKLFFSFMYASDQLYRIITFWKYFREKKKKKRIQKLYIVCRCCLLSGCLIAWCYSSWLVTKCYCSSKGLKPNTLTCTNHQQLPVWSYQLHLCPYLCCLVGSKSFFFSSLLHFFSYSKSHCLLIQRPLRSSALSTGLVKLCSPLSLLLITRHFPS